MQATNTNRTGNVWTASAHIITAMIGSGVLSLAWSVAQIGWIMGLATILFFSVVTFYTSTFLVDCYRSVNGERNRTYMDSVESNLGGEQLKICGCIQFLNLFVVAISYTIGASMSMRAIKKSSYFHESDEISSLNPYIIVFGITEIILSQIQGFDKILCFYILAAVMSITYTTIGLLLGIFTIADNGMFKGSLTGISIGADDVTQAKKIWTSFQALGNIAFAYAYSMILFEIQDTIQSPPSESKTMKRANLISVSLTTLLYMLCGCMGYAAFGEATPKNLFIGFGSFNPYWLISLANAAIVIHLMIAYQAYSQPLFAFIKNIDVPQRFPKIKFIAKEITIPISDNKRYNFNLFELICRTMFVVITTIISMLLPSDDVVGFLGALVFWPLIIYYPVEMYIKKNGIEEWTAKWWSLEILSGACLVITIAAAIGSVAGAVSTLENYKLFDTNMD